MGVLLAAFLSVCPQDDTVSCLPRTGSPKALMDSIAHGIRMALEEAGGKAGGLKVAYEDWDHSSGARAN